MFITLFLLFMIIGIRTLITLFPLLVFRKCRPANKDILSINTIIGISCFHMLAEIVIQEYLPDFLKQCTLVKIPVPYNVPSIFPDLMQSKVDLLNILSIAWIFGGIALFILHLCVSIFSDKASSSHSLCLLPYWYNPFFWILIKKAVPKAQKGSLSRPVRFLVFLLCFLMGTASAVLVDYTYTHKEPTDVVSFLGTNEYMIANEDYAERCDSSVLFGANEIEIQRRYSSRNGIDSIRWHYPSTISPDAAWQSIEPMIHQLTEKLGPPQEANALEIFLSEKSKLLEWTLITNENDTANLRLCLYSPDSNNISGETIVELYYKQ